MRDRVERAGTGLRRSAASLLSPTGLRGAAVEVTWVAAHAALYPLGVVKERAVARGGERRDLAGLSPLQRGLVVGDVEASGTPILLVHGMVDNRSIFTVLRRGLRRRGFRRVLAINYSPLTSDVRLAATNLATRVEQICAETGFERIHLIGHSMGGLVARYYVQRLDGDARVHTLVTLGTPHGGTKAARLIPHRLARQLRPDSELVAELCEPAPGCTHPVPGRLERPRPDDGAQARRPDRPPRPGRPQRAGPRGRPHVAADPPPDRARDRADAGPARPARRHRHAGRDADQQRPAGPRRPGRPEAARAGST